jgi:hypothetical protein
MNISFISKQEIPEGEEIPGSEIRPGIFKLIQNEYPGFGNDDFITLTELNKFRRVYLTSLVVEEKGQLAAIDRDVMEAIQNDSISSENMQEEIESELTLGQKVADKVASFGGSWTFILSFFTFLLIRIFMNV